MSSGGNIRFHRTVLVVEILGNEPYQGDLEHLSAAVTNGDFSGAVLTASTTEVHREAMAQLLTLQGSDPGFLFADDDTDDAVAP